MGRKITVTAALCAVILLIGIAVGSVYVTPADSIAIIWHRITATPLPEGIAATDAAIVWDLRLPRALLAFIVGAALSVSGAVMQSVLRNPLASSYTLGVSSGASLGAAIVIVTGISLPVMGIFTLPTVGFALGLGTILLAMGISSRLDGNMENNTIILTGMVISLFINAAVTLVSAIEREHSQRLIYWQMGSFQGKTWSAVAVLLPICIACTLAVSRFNRELDMLTFGEEQAKSMGVRAKRVKWVLLVVAAALTGSAISFVGVIGFVDLVAPHIVRRIFGASHRYVVPMSAVLGGGFMVLCDLAARTVVPLQELPVGAVTAMIGAPFFTYIYLSRRKGAR
ncbi:MAG: iron ABC transporter permease [Oscillospiraceae bacterium]|jgi:iron complex transport system permease protein|nr:iron ABC transporter permease [Oscillospiraceae bacterium]